MAARGIARAAVAVAVAGALGVTTMMAGAEPPRGHYGYGYGYGDGGDRPCEPNDFGLLGIIDALLELIGLDGGDDCDEDLTGLLDLLPLDPQPDDGGAGIDTGGGVDAAAATNGAHVTTDSGASTGTTTASGGSATTGLVDGLLGGDDARNVGSPGGAAADLPALGHR